MKQLIPPLSKNRRLTQILQVLLLMFCINLSANAAPPTPTTIAGDTSVCVGDTTTYSISPTSGLIYKWDCSSKGYVYSTTSTTASIKWGSAGLDSVCVYGIDFAGDTVEKGKLYVSVYNLPNTYLTVSSMMGCQQLGTSDTGEQPYPPNVITEKSGCIKTCENSTVTYYAHDSVGSTFSWNVRGAVSFAPMDDSCIVTWGSPGTGNVSVTTTNIHGCSRTINICIKVIEGPKAIFTTYADSTYNTNATSNSVSICVNGSVQFIDISTSTLISPIVSCLWDFGDGTFRSTGSPTTFSHKFKTLGTYLTRLVVRNSCGCTDTAYVTINVEPCEGLSIDCPSVVCEGAVATYRINPMTPCTPYDWTVKGGTILSLPLYTDAITVKWDNVDASGFGSVIFDGAGCAPPYTGKTVVRVPVIQNIGTINGPIVICPNSQFIYRMPEWPTTEFNWNIITSTGSYLTNTDQRNEIVINTLNTPGTITLKVNYTNTLTGCGGYATLTITVVPPVEILGPKKFCLNDPASWTLSGGAIGDWSLIYPDGTVFSLPSIPTFGAPLNQVGKYSLIVTGLACVPDPLRFTIDERPAIPASVTGIDSPCADVPYTFIGGGIAEGSTFGWAVSSGTVKPATGDSSKITFTGVGPYTIKTWRINGVAPYCTSDTLYTVLDNPHPNPVITGPDTVCGSSNATYSVSYTKGETYEYEIIPATAGSVTAGGTGRTPTVTWNNTSSASTTAILRVKLRKCNTFFTADLVVTINGIPTITLTPSADTVCSGEEVTFIVSGTPTLTAWTAVEYDFGDGTTSSSVLLTAIHKYINIGATKSNFSPRVKVTDLNGCTASFARANTNVWVRPLSVAQITPTGPISACTGSWTHTLTASISSGPATTTFFDWYKVGSGTSILSGTSASALAVSHPDYGSYYCVVTNIDGCTDTTNIVEIDSNCGGGGCSGRAVTFTSSVIDCGRVQVDATVTGGAILYSEWVTEPSAYDVVVTGTGTSLISNVKASFLKSGMYKFTFRVFFLTSPTDTCAMEFETSEIVPYVGGMLYSVVCTAGAYNVTVFDNSNYYPTTPITTYSYTIQHAGGAPSTSTGIAPSYTVTGLTPGKVYITHTVGDGTNPPCTVFDSLILPALPVVSIVKTGGYNPVCNEDGLINLLAIVTPSGSTIHWDFGDVSENDLNPVGKKYSTSTLPRIFTVTATATNEYGCSSFWNYNVSVVADGLSGFVNHTPSSPCEGEDVTLLFNSTGASTPTNFNWYEETSFLSSSVIPTKIVNTAGGYWAFVTDAFGCEFASGVHAVDYVEVPDGKISGDKDQCINVAYTLDGGAPPDILGGIHHQWIRNGVLISSFGNSITELQTVPGTYTYKLVTVVPNGGGFCTDTSDDFVVTVHGATAPPSVGFSILDCKDYTVELTASSAFAGTFNWSHGLSGSPVLAYSGGPYRVYLTDIYGCPSHSDIYVPKSPQEFLWIFPSGCYNLCVEGAPYRLVGPYGSFSQYDWMKNGISDVGGAGTVPDYIINPPGPNTYNLALDNFYCADTSEPMEVSFVPCPPSCGNNVIFDVLSTSHTTSPLCRDSILIILQGPPPGLPYTITAKNGIIIPNTGTLPLGPTPTTFRYIARKGFSGLVDTLILRVTMPDGSICLLTRYVTFSSTPCNNSLAKMREEGNEPSLAKNELAELLLYPNPAQQSVNVTYSCIGKAHQRSVEIYDMMGRLMSSSPLAQASGTIAIPLNQFSSGVYQVVLRQNNQIVLRSKLVVVQ